MVWIVLVIIGLVASSIGSLIGLGGGIIIVPALLSIGMYTNLLGDIPPQIAVGTTSLILIVTGLSSTLAYMKHKTVDYKSGFIFFAGSGPGAIIGAWVNKFLDLHSFNLYFGIFMIFVGVLLIVKNKLKPLKLRADKGVIRTFTDPSGVTHQYGFQPLLGFIVSFVVGFSSGLFGIGGGSLMVPAMILIFMFPPHVAVATSMLLVFLSALISSATHIVLGNVNWWYALALVPGAWFGAKFGSFLNTKIKSNTLVNLLRAFFIIMGLRLIYQGIFG
jgi:uncharacterized protein